MEWFGIEDICKYLFYAYIGLLLCKHVIEANRLFFFNIGMGICALGIAVILWNATGGGKAGHVICLLMLYFMVSLSTVSSNRIDKFIKYTGRHAFTIYIYSWPVQAVMEMVIVVFARGNWVIACLAMLFGGLMGPVLIYEFYVRKMRRLGFFDFLIGVK